MAKRGSEADTYSEEETQRRVEATLKAAFNTPPKHRAAKAQKPTRKPKAKDR